MNENSHWTFLVVEKRLRSYIFQNLDILTESNLARF